MIKAKVTSCLILRTSIKARPIANWAPPYVALKSIVAEVELGLEPVHIYREHSKDSSVEQKE